MAHLILFLADGFEEIEAITAIDLLRRASIVVTTVTIGSLEVRGAHDIIVHADVTAEAIPKKYDGIILPGGGPGTERLLESTVVMEIVKKSFEDGLICAAICAAPSVFGKAGILRNIRATCYPGSEDTLTGAKYIEAAVVRDKNVITSRGAGTALPFAVELISMIAGPETADRIKMQIVYN
jgi:4-methyl-5(b-hydroxyethyl)-thiazole monophosphate biosynthesis